MVLDVNLPDGSGFDFLRELKQNYSVPVILLTANDMETDIVTGFELGADDYITKPFSLAVLRARVNVALRHGTAGHPPASFRTGCYSFDFNKMEFLNHKEKIELSKTEQKLLRLLVENPSLSNYPDSLFIIVITITFCIILSLLVILLYHFHTLRIIHRLENMIDSAIDGSFTEQFF